MENMTYRHSTSERLHYAHNLVHEEGGKEYREYDDVECEDVVEISDEVADKLRAEMDSFSGMIWRGYKGEKKS